MSHYINLESQTKYISCAKNNIKLKLYLPRQERKINETLTFFKIVSLAFNALIPGSFTLVKVPLKLVLI